MNSITATGTVLDQIYVNLFTGTLLPTMAAFGIILAIFTYFAMGSDDFQGLKKTIIKILIGVSCITLIVSWSNFMIGDKLTNRTQNFSDKINKLSIKN